MEQNCYSMNRRVALSKVGYPAYRLPIRVLYEIELLHGTHHAQRL